MSTRRFPTSAEPLVDVSGNLSHNWYYALQSLTSSLVDVNNATPRTSPYFCNWSQADETRITLINNNLTITNQGAYDGARLTLVLIQGINSPHFVNFTSETNFGAAGPPTLSTVQGARDRLELIFNAPLGIYDVIYFTKGFSAPVPPPEPPPSGPIAVSKGSDYAIITSDSGNYFDNDNATGKVVLSLPIPVPGLNYHFTVTSPHILQIQATAGASISLGTINSPVDGFLSSDLPFSSIFIYAPKGVANQWAAVSNTGGWNVS